MKLVSRTTAFALALVAMLALAACAPGCSSTGTLHAPTTAGNIGSTGNVAYGVAGIAARQVLAMKVCAEPPVYPCVPQAVKDRVAAADTAAYEAAVAADAASATAEQKKAASDKAKALQTITSEPDIKKQTDLAAAQAAAAKP